MTTETEVKPRAIPNVGDVILTWHNTTIWFHLVTGIARKECKSGRRIRTTETRLLGRVDVMNRQRFISRMEKDGLSAIRDSYAEAKDFTPGKVSKGFGPWLLNKYAADLAGRNVFLRHYGRDEYAGKVRDDKPVSDKERKTLPPRDTWQMVPGQILYTSWGYDQTNVEYFEIVRRKGWFVWVQEIGSADAGEGDEPYMTGKSVPNPESRKGKELRRKIRVGDGKEVGSIKIDEVRDAWLWDGRRIGWTSYA